MTQEQILTVILLLTGLSGVLILIAKIIIDNVRDSLAERKVKEDAARMADADFGTCESNMRGCLIIANKMGDAPCHLGHQCPYKGNCLGETLYANYRNKCTSN